MEIRDHLNIKDEIDEMRKMLLDRRRLVIMDYDGADDIIEFDKDLSEEEMQFLRNLLRDEDIEEEDAGLILSLMAEHAEEVVVKLDDITRKFPHLIKNICYFCSGVKDLESLADFVLLLIKDKKIVGIRIPTVLACPYF